MSNTAISPFVCSSNCHPGETMGLPSGSPAKAIRLTMECANFKCSTASIQNTPKLDKRQYHGSAYGMLAAHRGYLRPTGQWNFQEVTVTGSKIKVELNGTVILDGDLSQVEDYMANSAHPGKSLVKGHFGFAGHNDPVQFRQIEIKRLEK